MSKIVLCVDDSATMQQVADITFRGSEFTYVGARNYDEGLDKARGQKPILILADSVMPGQGKSGYDLCQALKSDPATAGIPVVILIGNGAPYDNAKGVQVGADANLPKPWDTQTMLEKVVEVITKAATGVAKPGQGAATASVAAATAPTVPTSAKVMPASAAASAAMPPRSATIMGMPTIKMPAGVAPPAQPLPVAPAPQPVAATPAVKPAVVPPTPVIAPAPAMTTPGTGSSLRTPAAAAPAVTPAAVSTAAFSAQSRAPMITGTPTKRSVLVERTLAKMAARLAEAAGIEPGSPELLALLKLSAEVIERIVWEVVPDLAEQMIRENLHELTARRSGT